MDIALKKRKLRRTLVARILALDAGDRLRQEGMLAERFGSLPGLREAGTVLLYATAFPEEIRLEPALIEVLDAGKRLLCPRVDRAERRLRLFEVRSLGDDLEPGMMGIPEPAPHCREVEPGEVDWVLVPGLGFDPRGYRLGRGAGHYDRLLPLLRSDAPRWALAFDCQWVEALPIAAHDVPLDGIASPSRTVIGPRRQ